MQLASKILNESIDINADNHTIYLRYRDIVSNDTEVQLTQMSMEFHQKYLGGDSSAVYSPVNDFMR